MQRVPLESSVLASTLYFPREQVLELEFAVAPFTGISDSPCGSMGSSSGLIPRAVISTAMFGTIFPANGLRDGVYNVAR